VLIKHAADEDGVTNPVILILRGMPSLDLLFDFYQEVDINTGWLWNTWRGIRNVGKVFLDGVFETIVGGRKWKIMRV